MQNTCGEFQCQLLEISRAGLNNAAMQNLHKQTEGKTKLIQNKNYSNHDAVSN